MAELPIVPRPARPAAPVVEPLLQPLPRLLCIGAYVPGVDSYEWGATPVDLNLTNYEIVVVYLEGLLEARTGWIDNIDHRSDGKPPTVVSRAKNMMGAVVTFPTFDVLRGQLYRQAFSRGGRRRLIVIGDPLTQASIGDTKGVGLGLFPWMPLAIRERAMVNRASPSGDLALYVSKVESTTFSWAHPAAEVDEEALDPIVTALGCEQIQYEWPHPLAQSRGDAPVALRLSATAFFDHDVPTTMSAVWLPPTTVVPPREGLAILVRGLVGAAPDTEPSWGPTILTPAQRVAEARLKIAEAELATAQAAVDDLLSGVGSERQTAALLWEQGARLEHLVRGALEVLGCHLEHLPSDNQADVVFTTPTGARCVAEVKGTSKTLSRGWVRQLVDWRTVVWESDGSDEVRKAVLVLNGRRGVPPEDRSDLWPDDAVRAARSQGVSLLTTEHLFVAVCMKQASEAGGNEWDVDGWWTIVTSTDGVCDLPALSHLGIAAH